MTYTTHVVTFNKIPLYQGIDALYVDSSSVGVLPSNETAVSAKNKNSFHIEVYDRATLYFGLSLSNGYQLTKIQVGAATASLNDGFFVVENVSQDLSVNIITAPRQYTLSWTVTNASLEPITPDFEMRLAVNKGSMRGDDRLTVSYGDSVTFYPSGVNFRQNYHVEINGIQYSWESFGAAVTETGGIFTWTYENIGSDTTILFVKNT